MKPKVYLETTIVSYYTGRPTRDLLIAARQEETRALWPRLTSDFDTYISALVLEECSVGNPDFVEKRKSVVQPFPALDSTDEAKELAAQLLQAKAVPDPYPEDALHIAIAAVNGIDIILSLNFKHINNPLHFVKIRKTVESMGYQCPEICSPEQLMENEDD